jgi:putative transposase
MIERHHPTLSIEAQCRLLSISRSSFYYEPRGETEMNLVLMQLIDRQFLETPFYGVRQMTWHLQNEGHAVNPKRIRRLMRLMRLMPIYQKPNTSKPAKGHKTYPYLLGELRVERPNQVWCADITYLPMRRGFLYLVAIMDWFTRKVLAWRISNTLEADFCIEALNEAIHRFGPPEIMNTDQGSQFTGFAWTDRLRRVGTRISMDGKGRCLDNIFIERLWRSLKYECVYLHAWETGSQAKAGAGRWIDFYNHQRPHAAHGGRPPAVVYFNRIETDQQRQKVA